MVVVERHWAGPRVTSVSRTLSVLEMSVRQFFRTRGIPVRMVQASTYKRAMKACTGTYKGNKDYARDYAINRLILPDVEGRDRLHDLGDAAILAEYAVLHISKLQE